MLGRIIPAKGQLILVSETFHVAIANISSPRSEMSGISLSSLQPVYSQSTANCRCTSVCNADSHDIRSKIEQRDSSLSRHAMVPVDTKRVFIIFLQQPSCCVCFALTSKVENVVVCVHVGCGAALGCSSTSVAASQGNPGLDNIVCTPFKKQSTHSHHTTNAQLAHTQCTSLQSTYMQLTTSLQPVYNQSTARLQSWGPLTVR